MDNSQIIAIIKDRLAKLESRSVSTIAGCDNFYQGQTFAYQHILDLLDPTPDDVCESEDY